MSFCETAPVIYAVVLNWRDAASTRACVHSLLDEHAISRIVVVDNESSGELRSLASERVILLEEGENLGFSRGVNVGLRHILSSAADAALVINNDAIVEPGSVQILVDEWRNGDERLGLVAPAVLNADRSPQSLGGYFRAIDASTSDLAKRDRINFLTWACVLVPRRTMETVGLLDERFFMYWEDVDYGLRVRDAGLQLAVFDRAIVVHEKSKSHDRAGVAIDRYSARGLVLLCAKRGGLAKFIGMPLRILGRVLTRIPYGRGNVRAIFDGVRDARSLLNGTLQ